jgi:hypothetical protein
MRRRGVSTSRARTWGVSPYGALAVGLNFRNKPPDACGSLSQEEQGLSRQAFLALDPAKLGGFFTCSLRERLSSSSDGVFHDGCQFGRLRASGLPKARPDPSTRPTAPFPPPSAQRFRGHHHRCREFSNLSKWPSLLRTAPAASRARALVSDAQNAA